MNTKSIFGAILTLLGVFGLIYTAVIFSRSTVNPHDIKSMSIYGILGLIFFISGIGLVRATRDES